MTGYGRGESAQNGYKAIVEISSVNRKQCEISLSLPRELETLESRIRDILNRSISRGRCSVRISLHLSEEVSLNHVRLNKALARHYYEELKQLVSALGLPDPVTLDHIVRAPGIVQLDENTEDIEKFWGTIERALQQAIQSLIKMREREGSHLLKDLTERVTVMRKSINRVQKRAPLVIKAYRKNLEAKIMDACQDKFKMDEQRLLQEILLYSDKTDVSEEITRLNSHMAQFQDCVKSKEPVGRMLDFLAQEINREINTLGSKANDTQISKEVIMLKAELEKFREQVQNVE